MVRATILVICLLAGGCAAHMQPEIRGSELDALAEEMIVFISERSALEPAPVPEIVFVDDIEAVMSRRYGRRWDAMVANLDVYVASGFYEYETQRIYLPARWRPYPDQEGWLFHEIVHYLQQWNGRTMCASVIEREAYSLEREWLMARTGYRPPANWADKFIPAGC